MELKMFEYEKMEDKLEELDGIKVELPRKMEWLKKEKQLNQMSFDQLKEKLEVVIDRVRKFGHRVTKKTEQSVFLVNACKDFELDVIDNLGTLQVVTVDDKLESLKYVVTF